jgi:acyl dehydratase
MTEYGHLIGHRFPGGTFTLPEYLSWLWADAALAQPDPETAHPSLGYFVAMQGMGVTIQEIFDLLDTSGDAGVMFGETQLEFARTLTPGTTYAVDAEITGVERKSGRRAGAFDKLTFVSRVRDRDSGEPVVTNTNTWIIPRRES